MAAPAVHRHKEETRAPRGKAAPPFFESGLVLHGKFRIERMIGGGGFGQIYKATVLATGAVCAVKVEMQSTETGRMVLEQRVLHILNGQPHSPLLYASGRYGNLNFLVMEMLGKNLTEIRKKLKSKHFSVNTVSFVGEQLVEALRAVHDVGYLHRDVKPSNMCVGIGAKSRVIFLVDFGMTRQYRWDDGQIRRERVYAAFRGTMRYVSLNVHERREQGPVDDLWGIYYTVIELAEGQLPWRLVVEHDEIYKQKKKMDCDELCKSLPPAFHELPAYLNKMNFQSNLDYAYLAEIFKRCASPGGPKALDWETDLHSVAH